MFDNIAFNRYVGNTTIFNADKSITRVYWSMGVAITIYPSDKPRQPDKQPPELHVLFEDERNLTVG